MDTLINRFLEYVSHDTQSDTDTGLVPSTPGQMAFAHHLADELRRIGLHDVDVSRYGYVTATIPSNIDRSAPVVGFIAHMDTSPDMSGRGVRPRIVAPYDGNDIVLNEQQHIVLSPDDFPEMRQYIGQSLIVTDGLTLLGADDKAGVAEIVTAAEYLIAHPEIQHGRIRLAFTPDEEIGCGADHFDVEAFGADFAYTVDGGTIGELEYETFNAAEARIIFHGRNVHPGSAYHRMKNSMRIAATFVAMLPRHETPEHTSGYEGFYHLTSMQGDVELTTLKYIIRDFRRDRFEDRKREIEHLVNKVNAEFGDGTAELDMHDQYYNMREKIEPVRHIVDLAAQAMQQCGVTCQVVPVRGGTDGSRLSFMGLPTPNLFTGGHNYHGRFEFIPIESMHKAQDVIVRIAQLVATLP